MKDSIMKETIGIDLGDKSHAICVLDELGNILNKQIIPNDAETIKKNVIEYPGALVVMEVGTHSPWISFCLKQIGYDVIVANTRKVKAIWSNEKKCDLKDAEMLARIARIDTQLLSPIQHRSLESQYDLTVLKARDTLIKARTQFINFARGIVKSIGKRLPASDADYFHKKARENCPEELSRALLPVLDQIENLTDQIRKYDSEIRWMSKYKYPETYELRAIRGVGELTALAFVLILEDPERFSRSRQVGAFLGLVPRRDQSGETDKQLRITKAGDHYLRRLLVGCANYILGSFGTDCDLRRFGFKLMERGGKNAKRRAAVAVARKLSVLLHSLWLHKSEYDPDFQSRARKAA